MMNKNKFGYKAFTLGSIHFTRDEYFVYSDYPNGQHIMSVDKFLRALMRDIAWEFFYGTVSFDEVFSTVNHYKSVDICIGEFNQALIKAKKNYTENFPVKEVVAVFSAMLEDWVQPNFDPFAAPRETNQPWGIKKQGSNKYIKRKRITAQRMVGLPGDTGLRKEDEQYPINDHFSDVEQSEPIVEVEPGYENKISGFNLFAYLSRSDVTWNPSICSVLKDSLFCPTTEEYILPIIHGNDRVEWFIQLSDEINWKVEDKNTGSLKAYVKMKAGDIAAMPADIRHQGFSPKRSMLLVWENGLASIPDRIESGEMDTVPIRF
jgi:hypothetical protein